MTLPSLFITRIFLEIPSGSFTVETSDFPVCFLSCKRYLYGFPGANLVENFLWDSTLSTLTPMISAPSDRIGCRLSLKLQASFVQPGVSSAVEKEMTTVRPGKSLSCTLLPS